MSIDVKDADIHNVFRLLADVGKVNLVVSDDVKGQITIHVKNVRWSEVLDVVVRQKGLSVDKIGSVYHIETLEQANARAEAQLRIGELEEKSAPLRTVLIPVAYAQAESLRPIVSSMLSPRGKVMVDSRTNTLIVTDIVTRTQVIRRSVGH